MDSAPFPAPRPLSVWIRPEASVGAQLHAVIVAQSAALLPHGATGPFFPHVTVLGGIPVASEAGIHAVTVAVGALARETRAFSVEAPAIVAGAQFFQCVYALCQPSAPLSACFESLCAALPSAPRPFPAYMPHLSLVYGELPQSLREASAAALAASFGGQGVAFSAAALEVWDTTGPVESWRLLSSFALP